MLMGKMQQEFGNRETEIANKYHKNSAQDYLKIFGFTKTDQTGQGNTPGELLVEPSIRSAISTPANMAQKKSVKRKCVNSKRSCNKKIKTKTVDSQKQQYGGKKRKKTPQKRSIKFPFFKQ